MPWVLSDYTSDTLDLTKPSVYRDLTKPMGAQNPERLLEYIDRYDSISTGESSEGPGAIPPFHYGSHYSTMVGVVLHYLVRLQPFASLHRDVQDGFDVPDRLFASVAQAYHQNTHVLSEVKELTPEWFTLADFLRNINDFDLGTTHDGKKIGDVELPPWAEGSPDKFIRMNREALESEYVSARLPHWIDLIYGYKQQGKEAVEANNVFYYLSYYGAVDTSKMSDDLRKATELQVAHFGSHPMQLFRSPHPEKRKRSIPRSLYWCFDSSYSRFILPETQEEALSIDSCSTFVLRSTSTRVLKSHVIPGRIVCVLDNGVLEAYRYGMSDLLRSNLSAEQQSQSLNSTRRKIAESAPVKNQNEHANIKTFASEIKRSANDVRRAIGRFEMGSSRPRQRMGDKAMSFSPGHPSLDPDFSEQQSPSELKSVLEGTETEDKISSPKSSSDSGSRSPRSLPELIVLVEKDLSPFSVTPRVPVAPVNRSERLTPRQILDLGKHILFSASGRLVLSAGHPDGRVVCREIDTLTCEVISAGDFRAHRHSVCSMATDCISDGLTDVVASIDEAGQLLIWTVSKVGSKGIISRRPQRHFRMTRSKYLKVDLSWSMGIVAVCDREMIGVFSIEKNEIIHRWSIDAANNDASVIPKLTESEVITSSHVMVRKISLSNLGFIVASVETVAPDLQHSDFFITTFTLSGIRTGVYKCGASVTYMTCHQRGQVALVGLSNGSVELLSSASAELLYSFTPHMSCARREGERASSIDSSESNAVNHIAVGQSVIVVTSVSGNMFCRALPDFVKYEKYRTASSLSKLVNNPLQTVQQHAQTLSDAASSLKVHIDESIGELRKVIHVSSRYILFLSCVH